MDIRKIFLLLLTICSITTSSCDSGDIYSYAEDTMPGRRFTSFSIDNVRALIDVKAGTVELNLDENSSHNSPVRHTF